VPWQHVTMQVAYFGTGEETNGFDGEPQEGEKSGDEGTGARLIIMKLDYYEILTFANWND